MFTIKHVLLYKECLFQFCYGPILCATACQFRTTDRSLSIRVKMNCSFVLICSQNVKFLLFSNLVLVSSTKMGLRRCARMLLTALREKNCPFARKTVASWSLCSRRATLWGSIYCGSGIAGGLDGSRVVLIGESKNIFKN